MEITFKPSNKQWLAWQYLTDDTTTEVGYGGAASGGKSYLGCVWVTTMCLAYPGTGWVIGRKELTNLKKTTLLTLFKVFNEFGIDESQYQYNQQNNMITFGNKSQIFLIDLDNKPSDPLFTRLGGLEVTGYFIDESNECPHEGIEILKTRTGRRLNEKYELKPKGLETFNPSKNHVYTRFYRPWKDEELPDYRKFIQALPQDNPHTTEDYLNQLRNADKVTRMRLLEGNFEYDDDPSVLMKYDSIVDLFTNTITKGPDKYISVDVARFGEDKTVIMLWEDFEVVDVKMFTKQPLDVTQEEVRALASEHKIPFSRIIIDEDGIGGGLVDMLGGVKGFVANSRPVTPKIDGLIDQYQSNYANLKAQCYFRLADFVNSHRIAVKVDDVFVKNQLVEELEQIKRKDADKDVKLAIIPKDKMKEALGRSPDFADALMMRMWFEVAKGKISPVTQFGRAPIRRRRVSYGIINDAY